MINVQEVQVADHDLKDYALVGLNHQIRCGESFIET